MSKTIFNGLFYIYFLLIIYLIQFNNCVKIYDSIKSVPSSKEGFSTFKLGLSNNCKPLYYVDINNDKLTDIIASCKTSKGSSKISYFIYDESSEKFKLSSSYPTLEFDDSQINTFFANDLNNDGQLDYVLTLKKFTTYESRVYIYNTTSNNFDLVLTVGDDNQNLFIADIGSKRNLKIIYFDKKSSLRKVFYYDETQNLFITKDFTEFLSQNSKICDQNEKFSKMPFEIPNTNAFIDIDGDCINDIIISSTTDPTNPKTRYLEIWKGIIENKEIKYCLSSNNLYNVDNSLGLFTVVDVDRNAMPDLVFPVLNSNPPQILVAYNKIAMEYDWTNDFCSDHSPLNFDKSSNKISQIFDNLNSITTKDNIHIITISNNNNYQFYSNEEYPLMLRFIDINQDSYPDFGVILWDKSSKSKKIIIFLSQEILNDEKNRRNFNENNIYTFDNNLETDYDLAVVSFFDFGDNRKMDLLISDINGNVLGLYNNNVYDTYTLKSILVSKTNCFFCTELGSSQRFITTNIDGARRMDLSLQSPQISSPGILAMTFAYLGIGRSNNYIENFHIISGNAYNRKDNDKTYTPVIPNSQLIIYHNVKENNETTWQVDLVVKPTKNLYKLIIVIILMIVIMTFYAVRLQMKEREEDNIENKETFAPWFG